MMHLVLLQKDVVTDAYAYTIDKVIQNLIALEDHFKDYPCWNDCIPKHIEALKLYLNEAIDLAPENHRQFWKELKDEFLTFVDGLKEDGDLNEYAQKVRQMRKKVFAFISQVDSQLNQCPVCSIPILFLGLASIRCVTKDEWKWEEKKPKTPSERQELLRKCGRECFLDPSKLKFPICNKQCCIDCDGLRAAYVRARAMITAAKKAGYEKDAQYYANIANMAKQLAIKYGCEWVKNET